MISALKKHRGSPKFWVDDLIAKLRGIDRAVACLAMKKFMSTPPNQASSYNESEIRTPKCEQKGSTDLSGIVALSCLLVTVTLWALLATFRPSWLWTLKKMLTNLFKRFKEAPKDSESDPETLEPNTIELSTTPKLTPEPEVKIKTRRRKAPYCPYKRNQIELRQQIQRETYADLRRLIRLAKLEAKEEVEAELKVEAKEEDTNVKFTDV